MKINVYQLHELENVWAHLIHDETTWLIHSSILF